MNTTEQNIQYPFIAGFNAAFDQAFFTPSDQPTKTVQDVRYALGIRNCLRDPRELEIDGSVLPSHPSCSDVHYRIEEREFLGQATKGFDMLSTKYLDGVEALVKALNLRNEDSERAGI